MIIETKSEFLEFLSDYNSNDVIITPLMVDSKRHIFNNKLCLLYIKILNFPRYYTLSFNHTDAINLNYNILNLLNSDMRKYTFNKKDLINIYNFKNVIDVNAMFYANNNKPVEFSANITNAEKRFLSMNIEHDYKFVPILKLEEKLLEYSNNLENIINQNSSTLNETGFNFINDITINNLHEIEKNGLYIDKNSLLVHAPDYELHINDNYIYTDYNIYTLTGRPSNSFKNLNFSALNKDTKERDFIISRHINNGELVYFDYEAYHFNLLANIMKYEFPEKIPVYEYLGKYYFNKNSLSEDEYKQAKSVSFEILYGGIDNSIAKAVPFFDKAKQFIEKMWEDYIKNSYIETYISKKKIYFRNLSDMNPNKLFNYFLQNYETEQNMIIMQKLIKYLDIYKTKLIMYLYDGFLIDFYKMDNQNVLNDIKNIIEDGGKFKIKQYSGKNFGNLKKVT